jgi:hypothetical protein
MTTKRPDGFTPKTYALSTAISALYYQYRTLERNPDDIDGTPAFRRGVMKQLAILHNRMLDNSGLDGLHIPVPGVEEDEYGRRIAS